MGRTLRQGQRDARGVTRQILGRKRLWRASGQRAGFVKDDRVDLGQTFQRRAVLDQKPLAK